MSSAKPSFPKILPLALVLFLGLWFLIRITSPAAQQEQTKWTAQNHDKTNFPLVGKHQTVACRECHLKGIFEGTPTACEACHWERRQDDRYKLQLGLHCGDCHTPQSWKDVLQAKWNHTDVTGFRLEGVHRTLDCADCHRQNGLGKAAAECYACHQENFESTKNPGHSAAGFPTQCQICHRSTAAWQGAVFSHKFNLLGKHKLALCSDCHKSGQYAGLPTACLSCHLNDYNNANDPNHKQAGFPTDCVICHGNGASGWQNAKFEHTTFVLKGKHKIAACADCHKNGQYAGTPSTCISCHLNDYNGTTDPNHKQANYSTDCVTCHGAGAQSWSGASANHDQFWPLQGAHKTLTCNTCHSKGYNLPKDCYGCHAANYNSTTNPNHKSSGYSTSCENCHYATHTSWTQAVFAHNFPIKSGRHAGFSCTDCHLTSNYNQFSCIDCHTHSRSTTDSHHSDVGGYSYNSQACYSCHPRGAAGD